MSKSGDTASRGTGVGLIAADAPYGRHLAARLQARLAGGPHPLVAVLVIEKAPPATAPSAPPPETIGQRLRRTKVVRKLWRVATPAGRLRRAVERFERKAVEEFRFRAGPVPDWPRGVHRLVTTPREVNAPATVDWSAGHGLRLLVLAGAPILREPMLETAENVLNMHSALLPRYRGTRAEFWQVHNGEIDQAGVTIHFVDPGVDTGDILRRVPLNPAPQDGPWLMRVHNQLNGLEAMPAAVEEVLSGTARRVPQEHSEERAYRYSDITPEATRRVLKAMRRRPRPGT